MAIWRNASEAWMGADPDDDGVDVDTIIDSLKGNFEDALLISIKRDLDEPTYNLVNWILEDLLMGKAEGLNPEIVIRVRKADDLFSDGPCDEDAFYLKNPVLDEDIPAINQWIQAQEALLGVPQETLTVKNLKEFDELPQHIVDHLVENWKAPEPDYGY